MGFVAPFLGPQDILSSHKVYIVPVVYDKMDIWVGEFFTKNKIRRLCQSKHHTGDSSLQGRVTRSISAINDYNKYIEEHFSEVQDALKSLHL